MCNWKTGLAIATVALLLAGCASNTERETPETEVEGPIVSEADHADREFSDEEVENFAAAYIEVTAIQQDYQVKIQEAEGAEREQLEAESRAETEAVMAEYGMTPEEYNAIAVRLPEDDELRQRVQQAVQELEQQRVEETEQQLEVE